MKNYDDEFKVQAIKLGKEIGFKVAAKELDIPADTLYGWNKAAKEGRLDLGPDMQTPHTAKALAAEVKRLHEANKALERENRRLKEENAILEDASAFFAARRLKSKRD